ncbi:hypothetical protein QQS21_000116 [Conoideocrella luteorostrata]|uniref:Uncharacterized protein n=1 Tax=Conoideocrella luteorostrata TaxID=1105319 RepID=A0AAJ0D1R5_9HYPO|nr:hypothetical protein QQS21_000116 [Conoideocrella luteorostrata]
MSPSEINASMTPDYEVRMQLDPALVLDSEHGLINTVLSTFNVSAAASAMNVQFLDTCDKDIFAAEWNVRVRKAEDKPDLELTYKKRYSIANGDIDAALTTAKEDGFTSHDTKWEAQIEWGYEKQTLSISHTKKSSCSGTSNLHLPGKKDSRALLIKEAPDKFDNWGPGRKWGTIALEKSRIYGPILAKRYTGKWNNIKLYVEVWPIIDSTGNGIEYIIEASFKANCNSTASDGRNRIKSKLQKMGWLISGDALKTQIILERYGCSQFHEEAM